MEIYYEVLVASLQFHGEDTLTYKSTAKLVGGRIVTVPLKNKQVLATIIKEVSRPAFATKPLEPLNWPPLPVKSLQLLAWMREYYPAPLGAITQQFLPQNLTKQKKPLELIEMNSVKKAKLPTLTTEQKLVLSNVVKPGTYLLHGDTGSGKTRVYQELALKSIKEGKSAVILTPEISLTSQLIIDFQKIFGNQVVLVHSQLKDTERRAAWLKILTATDPLVVIGTRSALFSPLRKVGLIVIDEEHELAYKQEQTPYYHAIRVASKLAELHEATLILGSATPSVVDYFIAEQKHIPILRMEKMALANKAPKADIEIIDLKDRANFSLNPHLSDLLLKLSGEALGRNEQVLIFLNRRGTARVILCPVCGWQALCPNCDTALIYHGDNHTMRCHTCSYSEQTVSACPVCNNADIIFKTIGTKAIVEDLEKIFPKARIQRFDTDNKKSERLEQNYNAIHGGEVDILVGTQTLAKGLDLPRLSLVGIVTADTSLAIPDFTAQERLYQLISQVAGRVGRGHREGRVVIQTYAPDNSSIQAVLTKDWPGFYKKELAERNQFTYPPFCYLLKLVCSRASSLSAEENSAKLIEQLRALRYKVEINGPAPAFHERLGSKYSWQLIIKSKQRAELLKIVKSLPSGWHYDLDPINLL